LFHYAAHLLIGFVISMAPINPQVARDLGVGAGIVKEIHDKKADPIDAAMTAVGAHIGYQMRVGKCKKEPRLTITLPDGTIIR
jgi:hypothetical protein